MIRRGWLVFCLVGLLHAEAAEPGSAAPQVTTRRPQISSIFPMSGQPGRTVPFEIRGQFLDGGRRIVFESSDLTGSIESASFTRVTGTLSIAPDSSPGARYFRIITPRGTSNLLVLRVTQWPEAQEHPRQEGVFSLTAVTVPVLISGRLVHDVIGPKSGGEEADSYRFHAKPGDRLNLTVLGARNWIRSNLTLTLLRADGRQLDFDEGLFRWDPYLDYTFLEEGDYTAAVTTSRAKSSRYGEVNYQLAIGAAPIIWGVFPMGVRRGETFEGELRADFVPRNPRLVFDGEGLSGRLEQTGEEGVYRVELRSAPDAALGWHHFRVADDSGTQAPIRFYVGNLPEQKETEPNDSRDQAENLSWPGTVNGRMDHKNDHDFYKIDGKAAEWVVVELNSGDSRLDATLKVFDSDGKILASADDGGGAPSQNSRDPLLMHRFGEDGAHYLLVESVYRHYGTDQNYRLTVRRPNPGFRLEMRAGRRRGPLPGPVAPRGGEGKLNLSVKRLEGFECEVKVLVSGLPAGVAAKPLIIAADQDSGTLELSAAADAPLGVTLIEIIGKAWNDRIPRREIVSRVVVEGNPLMGEGPGFLQYETPQPLLSVVEPTRFSLETMLKTVVIVRGQRAEVPVALTREEGFEPPLEFSIENLPPGLKLEGWQELDEGKMLKLLLQADEDATPVRHSSFVVIAKALTSSGIIMESAPAVGLRLD